MRCQNINVTANVGDQGGADVSIVAAAAVGQGTVGTASDCSLGSRKQGCSIATGNSGLGLAEPSHPHLPSLPLFRSAVLQLQEENQTKAAVAATMSSSSTAEAPAPTPGLAPPLPRNLLPHRRLLPRLPRRDSTSSGEEGPVTQIDSEVTAK